MPNEINKYQKIVDGAKNVTTLSEAVEVIDAYHELFQLGCQDKLELLRKDFIIGAIENEFIEKAFDYHLISCHPCLIRLSLLKGLIEDIREFGEDAIKRAEYEEFIQEGRDLKELFVGYSIKDKIKIVEFCIIDDYLKILDTGENLSTEKNLSKFKGIRDVYKKLKEEYPDLIKYIPDKAIGQKLDHLDSSSHKVSKQKIVDELLNLLYTAKFGLLVKINGRKKEDYQIKNGELKIHLYKDYQMDDTSVYISTFGKEYFYREYEKNELGKYKDAAASEKEDIKLGKNY